MSLPTLSSGSLSTARKSGWRLLPEIHASRLSVSGSLRPKLGLLILSILLLISLCFVLVPVLSKLKFPPSRTIFSPRDLPLQKLYNEVAIQLKYPSRKISFSFSCQETSVKLSFSLLGFYRPSIMKHLQIVDHPIAPLVTSLIAAQWSF